MIKEFFENIFANAKARADDPFLGPFVASWVLWNWSHLALLFFGEDKASLRINKLYDYFANAKLWELSSILWLPFISTVLYIFILPWIKFYLNKISNFASKKLHSQAVDVEIEKMNKQRELNEANLLADPGKKFLEKAVETKLSIESEKVRLLEIDNRNKSNELELGIALADKARAEASEAEALAKAEEMKMKTAESNYKEAELKKQAAEVENNVVLKHAKISDLKYELETLKLRAEITANTFPSLYVFIEELSNSFTKKGAFPTIRFLSNIVALVFGYQNSEDLLKDEDFTNETFTDVKYIFFDEKYLSRSIETFVLFHPSRTIGVDSIMVLDSIRDAFESLPYKFVNLEELKDLAFDFAENNKLDLLHSGELASIVSSHNSDFKDVIVDEMNEYDFNEGFSSDFRMVVEVAMIDDDSEYERHIPVKVELRSDVVLGKYALSEFEFSEVVDLN